MADDADLEEIRARRMAELHAQMGLPKQIKLMKRDRQNEQKHAESLARQTGRGGSDEQQKEKERQMEEMKNSILSQVLDQSARTRLNTIAVAKPEKAKMVESMLIQMAQSGQLPGKLNENQLKDLLGRVSERTQKTTTVKFDRRRAALDSDED